MKFIRICAKILKIEMNLKSHDCKARTIIITSFLLMLLKKQSLHERKVTACRRNSRGRMKRDIFSNCLCLKETEKFKFFFVLLQKKIFIDRRDKKINLLLE